jgi:transposase
MKQIKFKSDPDALVAFIYALGFAVTCIRLEAGPLSQRLYSGLTQAGFETPLLETRHVKAALSAMTVKTDRRDARGIRQLLRMGWFPAQAALLGRLGVLLPKRMRLAQRESIALAETA